MTNEEIDKLVSRAERKSLHLFLVSTPVSSFDSLLGASIAILLYIAFGAQNYAVITALLAVLGGAIFYYFSNQLKNFRSRQTILLWKLLSDRGLYGKSIENSTRQLTDKIAQIHEFPLGRDLMPIRQAIRLIDVYERQQRHLRFLDSRLREMYSLKNSLSEKLIQLQKMGEEHAGGNQNLLRMTEDYEVLERAQSQVKSSSARLELIVISAQNMAHSRQLRRELDEMSAQTPSNHSMESAFEPESLEEIERQIGREIETYLQLERETEEHLR